MLKVKLVKSTIGCKKDQIATAYSLGLRKIGDSTILKIEPDAVTLPNETGRFTWKP